MFSTSPQDQTLFTLSSEIQGKATHPFLKRDWQYCFDMNNQNYAGNTITYDSTSFCSSQKWLDYYNSMIAIPLVVTVSSANDTHTSSSSDLMLAYKNSSLNLIHSASIEINGVVVCNNYAYANSLLIFKQHCTKTLESIRLNSPMDGYYPDDSSWVFRAAPSGEGQGICNNLNLPPQYSPLQNVVEYNSGMRERQKMFTDYLAADQNGHNLIYNSDVSKHLATSKIRNVTVADNTIGGVAGPGLKVYYHTAFIKLRDISDIFEHLPICKNLNVRIILTLNNNISCTVRRTVDNAGGVITSSLSQTAFSNPTSLTNPLLFAAAHTPIKRQGNLVENCATPVTFITEQGSAICCTLANNNATTNTDYVIKQTICGEGNFKHDLNSTRLIVPTIIMNPSFEAQYVTNVIRDIEYSDIIQTSFTCPAGQSVQQLVNPGLVRLAGIVIVPVLYNDVTSNGANLHSYSSIFASEPSTASPCQVKDLQITLGVNPLFPQPLQWQYENFLNGAHGVFGLNSNIGEFCSGQISYEKFNSNYGYICLGVDRRTDQEEMTSQSVTVQLTNNTLKSLQFMVYLIRRRNLEINILTGERKGM